MLKNLGHSVLIATAVTLPILTWGGDATHFPFRGQRALAQDELSDPLSFTVENFTDYTLLEFYVSPTDVSTWEEEAEKLQGDSVAPGDVREIVVDDSRSDCFYDVRGVFDQGPPIDENQVDLCIDEGTYTYYDDNDRTFNIQNTADLPLLEIYFTPVTQADWGEDLIAQELSPGDIAIIPVDSNECLYDFRGVYSDGQEQIVREIEVCNADGTSIEGPIVRFDGRRVRPSGNWGEGRR
ncbi:MAG: hypothetical protein SFY66_22985 [Oculatellaceae cyanobacterium bins.114]|nr:hypothetical protein [Oculatellaceae cyanobacterium bins.114]